MISKKQFNEFWERTRKTLINYDKNNKVKGGKKSKKNGGC